MASPDPTRVPVASEDYLALYNDTLAMHGDAAAAARTLVAATGGLLFNTLTQRNASVPSEKADGSSATCYVEETHRSYVYDHTGETWSLLGGGLSTLNDDGVPAELSAVVTLPQDADTSGAMMPLVQESGAVRSVPSILISRAMDAEAPLVGVAGIRPAEADGGPAELAQSDLNRAAVIARLGRAAELGMYLKVPDRVTGPGAQDFYPVRGYIEVPEGGVLGGGGVLRVPDDAMTSDTYRTAIRFVSGIQYAEVNDITILGNAGGNETAHIEAECAAGGATIRGLWGGIYWGPLNGRIPPKRLRLQNVRSGDHWSSCFVGSGSYVDLINCEAWDTRYDHWLYGTPGSSYNYDGYINIVGALHCHGYARGSGVDVTRGRGLVIVRDLVANPDTWGEGKVFGVVAAARSYRGLTNLQVVVSGNLEILQSLATVSYGHHDMHITARHTGPADLATEGSFSLLTLQDGGPTYYGQPHEGNVAIRAIDLPGGTDFFYLEGDPVRRLTPDVRVRFHPHATKTSIIAKMIDGGGGIDAYVDAPMSPAGGGVDKLLTMNKTGAVTRGKYADIKLRGRVQMVSGVIGQDFDVGDNDLVGFDLTQLDLSKTTRGIGTTEKWARYGVDTALRVPFNTAQRFPSSGTTTFSGTIVRNASDLRITVAHGLSAVPTRRFAKLDDLTGAMGQVLGVSADATNVYIDFDPASIEAVSTLLAVGATISVTGTMSAEVEQTCRMVVDEPITITAAMLQSGTTVFDIPTGLSANPGAYTLEAIGATPAITVRNPQHSSVVVGHCIRTTFATAPVAGTDRVWLRARAV